MNRFRSRRTALTLCAGLIGVMLAGCDDDTTGPGGTALDELRAATESFRDLGTAQAAGYSVLVIHPTTKARCLADPELGGMGFHYLNTDLMDDVVVETSPEVVIYEPHADGTVELVAVEYLIPFAIRGEDQPPPVLFGHEFVQNHTFPVWALHAWAWKENPSGDFASYNPDVSCQFADEVL